MPRSVRGALGTCSEAGEQLHLCPARPHLGGQGPSREGSLVEVFQVLRRELSRGKSVPTSVLSRPHGTSDLVQFSPLVLQKRSPRAREVKAAPAGDRTGHPGPPAPCSQEEASLLSGASLLALHTLPPATGAPKGPGTRILALASSGVGGAEVVSQDRGELSPGRPGSVGSRRVGAAGPTCLPTLKARCPP